MPQMKIVESLYKLCVKFVSGNIDQVCKECKLILTAEPDPGKSNNPFDVLPSIVIANVEDLCCDMNLEHRKMVLTPHLKNASLFHNHQSELFPKYVYIALIRCPELEDLSICLPAFHEDIFMKICATSFHKLLKLDISATMAGDECLKIIGTYCRNLKELKVEDCGNMTDAGMRGLCLSVDHLGEKLGSYKSMERLNICRTQISEVGAKLVLENFRSLKFLSSDFFNIDLLFDMHSQQDDVQIYAIDHIDVLIEDPYVKPYVSGSLGLVASICPLVTTVVIESTCDYEEFDVLVKKNHLFSDREFLTLLQLNNLKSLSICAGNSPNTFDGGVSPLLRALGRQLEYLELQCFSDVKMTTVIENCPNLRILKLFRVNLTYQETLHSSSELNLEIFHFFGYKNNDCTISNQILVSLLSSSLLKFINISRCLSFNDNVMKKAFERNQFKNLEIFKLWNCNSISKRGIETLLLDEGNPLQSISISRCNLITADNIVEWKEITKSKNWNLKFD